MAAIVQNFKAVSTRRINQMRDSSGAPVWQRSYHDHIVRGEAELQRLREYIQNNPLRWEMDTLHPQHPDPARPRIGAAARHAADPWTDP